MRTVNQWKKSIKRQFAIKYKIKADKIRLVSKDSKRGIKATWERIDNLFCPINKKFYRVYWVRTLTEFKQGVELPE